MSGHVSLTKLLAVSAGVFVVFLIFGGNAVVAQDNSAGSVAAYYDTDDCSKGFSIGHPQDAWRGLDMIYFRGYLYQLFYKPYNWENCNDTISVYIYRKPVADTPAKCPGQIELQEVGQTYCNQSDGRKINGARFAVFRDRIYVYTAKTYDDNTGFILWEKSSSPDGTNWTSNGKNIWENRQDGTSDVIQGFVVKVMNDKLYILIQPKNSHGDRNLYLITYDGTTYTREVIHTFTDNACILNGDVIRRASDNQPLLAFVTKDDLTGGSNSTGTSKLYVFDPSDKSVTYVTAFADKWKDLAVVQGNVYNCKPYSINALQIWGFPWNSDNLYHMQFIFNDDGKSGTFSPSGRMATGHGCSSHVDNQFRGYLAAAGVPEQVEDTEGVSLQSYDWVWWWGSTTTANAYGRSLKYRADYLKSLGSNGDPTSSQNPDPLVNTVDEAWVLLGIITGLPPYYPNGFAQKDLGAYNKVSYGNKYQLEIATSVTSEKSVSVGYKSTFFKGNASMGFSYSNSVEDTTGTSTTTTAAQTLTFDPTTITPGGISNGAQAWGVFLAPYIMSDMYQLYAPDKTLDLGLTLYYTYIGDQSSIVSQVFDMTDPLNPANDPFFHGFPTLPNSLDYEIWKDGGPIIVSSGTTDYATLLTKQILCNNCSSDWEFSTYKTVTNAEKNTNTVSFSGGMFGFESTLSGSLTMTSSNSTSLGQNITAHYGVPGFTEPPESPPIDYDRYLTYMNMNMFLLNAKNENAFWIPAGAKTADRQHYPWCLTWDVVDYTNMGMLTIPVATTGTNKTVNAALASDPGGTIFAIQIDTPVIETEEVVIGDRSVSVRGAPSSLGRDGKPTITVTAPRISVGESGHLHLENLIIKAGSAGPVLVSSGNLSIKNCLILGDEGDAIVQDGGTLAMKDTTIIKSGADGLRVNDGYAYLANCALSGNAGNGLRNENGTVILRHCGLLQNGMSDFSSGSSAVSEATNTVIGSVFPGSKISKLVNCLVENIPESAVIEEQQDSILKKKSGYVVEDGKLAAIMPNSRCIDAGTALATEEYDMLGNLRWQKPDIGPLEYSKPMEMLSIETMQFNVATGPDHPSIETDSLKLVLELQVPSGFTLREDADYALVFGNRVISSREFNRSKTKHGLLFFKDSSDSSLLMELTPNQKQLKMTLDLVNVQLYQPISEFVHNLRDKISSSTSTSTVYMPVRVAAGDFQTGEVWMSFTFAGQNGVATGSAPHLRPID